MQRGERGEVIVEVGLLDEPLSILGGKEARGSISLETRRARLRSPGCIIRAKSELQISDLR
ncbi:hypothetical protein D9M71_677860 [compost metagenome]